MNKSAKQDAEVQEFLFESVFEQEVSVSFDGAEQSSDGGALLLGALDQKLKLSAALAAAFCDRRQAGKIDHGMLEMLRQRIYGIASGYEDGNDAGRLSRDALFPLVCGKEEGELASASTLCRWENMAGWRDGLKMLRALAETTIRQLRRTRGRKGLRRIILDLDPTDDATHGQQEFSFFNGYYDSHCYLPLLAFVAFEGAEGEEPEQHLVAALLRSGKAHGSACARGLMRIILPLLREAFPGVPICVRLDGAYATPEVFSFLEAQGVEYMVNMASNAVLEKLAAPFLDIARERARRTKQTAKVYARLWYRAQSWPQTRAVIVKAEVVVGPDGSLKDNPRFVVNNLDEVPRKIYARRYCRRGDVENRIKELKETLALGRTSCSSFWANQFRVLLSAAAYVLMQGLRAACAGTALERAQAQRLRDLLLKVSARVSRVTRRVYVELSSRYAWAAEWRQAAGRIVALVT